MGSKQHYEISLKVISDHRSEFPILSNWNEEA